MKRYIEGVSRDHGTLIPDRLEDWIDDENVVRVIDGFVDELDLPGLGFELAEAAGRPGYLPSALLKLYIYGYLNRVQSSRRLERETLRNVEVVWLLGRLSPDHKTIADFRKGNGEAIRKVCAQFVELCRDTRYEDGLNIRRYWTDLCSRCSLKAQCTPSKQRRVSRWEHEEVLEAVQRPDENPQTMRQRRETVEHPFGTIKMRLGATHFLMKRLKNVRTEMALSVLAYNLTRVISILGVTPLIQAIQA